MDYEKIIRQLYEKADEEGLTIHDARIIKGYIEILKNEPKGSFIADYQKYINQFEELFSELYYNGLFHKYSSNNIEYIKRNSQLLALIFANDNHRNIRMYAEDSFCFLCQFHNEKTPSLGVTNDKNLYHCFGCGRAGNVFNYIMYTYNVTFMKAVEIVAAIFKMELPNKPNEFNDEIRRIIEIITKDEYLELLFNSYLRKKKRNRLGSDDEELYYKQIKQLENIKNGLSDIDFKYEKPVQKVLIKRLRLENDSQAWENFDISNDLPF